jgi:hypothetical protein
MESASKRARSRICSPRPAPISIVVLNPGRECLTGGSAIASPSLARNQRKTLQEMEIGASQRELRMLRIAHAHELGVVVLG